jgi:adiponectin receptor
LIGALVAVLAFFYLYNIIHPRYEAATHQDVLVFACFFAGATACLSLSATFHLFSNHSQEVQKFGNQLDYLGIVFLIWGSFIPSIYYGFQRDPELIRRYWTMITTISAVTAASTMMPVFRTPTFRPVRASMFVAMGLSAVFPALHGLRIYGYEKMRDDMGLNWLVIQGVLYISGAALYAARVPERFAPGKFDILGSSHQIFHILVLLAAATHLRGLLIAFDSCHGGR